jgi:hypothetical protein
MATSGKGTTTVGYNVQIAVDAEHHLIVAHEVINQGCDRHQLAPMAFKAQQAMGHEQITAPADRGYFNGDQVLAIRARLLMTQGDTRRAARLAPESLEIATEYDMRLRKVHALNLLAEITNLRGQTSECRILLERSAALANGYGFPSFVGMDIRPPRPGASSHVVTLVS